MAKTGGPGLTLVWLIFLCNFVLFADLSREKALYSHYGHRNRLDPPSTSCYWQSLAVLTRYCSVRPERDSLHSLPCPTSGPVLGVEWLAERLDT